MQTLTDALALEVRGAVRGCRVEGFVCVLSYHLADALALAVRDEKYGLC
jgi:hypothetical protein